VTSPRSPFELTQVAIEPVRRGFVVDENDLDQLVLAMRAATSLWGGQRGIIVPRLASGELAPGGMQMAEVAGVDSLVDFSRPTDSPPPPAPPLTATRPFSDVRSWQPPPIVTFDLDQIEGRTIKYAAQDAGAFLVAALGAVADDGELEDWSSRHAHVHEYQESELAPAEILRAQADAQTGLATTIRHAPVYFAQAPFAQSVTLIWVVPDATPAFDDLLSFWNLRALRPSDIGISLVARRGYFNDPVCLAQMREIVSSRARMSPAVVINGLSGDRRALAGCARRLGFARKRDTRWSENPFGKKAATAVESTISVEMRQFWLGQRRIGLRASADTWRQDDGLHLRCTNPLRFAQAFTGASPVQIRWQGPGLHLPRRPAVAQLFLPTASWSGDALQWVAALQSEYQFVVQEPTREQVLAAATSATFTLSDKGRELSALRARLTTPGIFRQSLALDVITALTPDDSRRLRRGLRAHPDIQESSVVALVNSMDERRSSSTDLLSALRAAGDQVQRTAVNAVLEALVAAQVVDRGLEVVCGLCAVREFIQLNEYRPTPRCRGCHAPARYRDSTGEPELVYRLNTLLRRISANGGLPMLSALAVLEDEGAYVLPGVEGGFGEVDILGYDGPKVFAGECKTSAEGFTDVARDLQKSKNIGADQHLIVCRAAVNAQIRAAVAAQADAAGLELRVLDATALFE